MDHGGGPGCFLRTYVRTYVERAAIQGIYLGWDGAKEDGREPRSIYASNVITTPQHNTPLPPTSPRNKRVGSRCSLFAPVSGF